MKLNNFVHTYIQLSFARLYTCTCIINKLFHWKFLVYTCITHSVKNNKIAQQRQCIETYTHKKKL